MPMRLLDKTNRYFYLPVTERQYTASASSRCNEVAGLLCRDDYAVNESVIYIHCTVRSVCVCVCVLGLNCDTPVDRQIGLGTA